MANKIPQIIQTPRASISTERALKQIKEHLETFHGITHFESSRASVEASIDDVDTMLEAIDRG